jgi:hypothetical protein
MAPVIDQETTMRNTSLRTAPALFGFLLVAATALVSCGDDAADTTTVVTTTPVTTAATTSTTGVPVTEPSAKTPAATVEDLVAALYDALNAKDDAAFRALSSDTAYHDFFYYNGSGTGRFPGGFAHESSNLAATGLLEIEVLGDPLVSGEAVAIPTRYTHTDEVDVGFDLLVLKNTPDGYLIAGGATFYAKEGVDLDIDSGVTIWEEHLRWNDGDTEGVLDFFADGATMWDQVTDPTARVTGDELAGFVAASLWFDIELPGDPMFTTSGPFAVVPTRLVATTDTSDGITLYLIRDGKVVLQAFAQ